MGGDVIIQKDNTQAKAFIVVASIIIFINLVGIFYGFYADIQYEKAKELIQEAYNKEYVDGIEEFVANCNKSAEMLGQVIMCFIIKILVGACITCKLVIPKKIYDLLEIDIMEYVCPDETYQIVIEIIIGVLLIWNIISPLLDLGNYISLRNELMDIMANINWDELLKEITVF